MPSTTIPVGSAALWGLIVSAAVGPTAAAVARLFTGSSAIALPAKTAPAHDKRLATKTAILKEPMYLLRLVRFYKIEYEHGNSSFWLLV
jgi:hypothetical protein